MAIVVGIDGTGSAFMPGSGRDREYDASFANSFVSRICRNGGVNKRYFRGPVALGGGLVEAIAGGVEFIKSRLAGGVDEPILLTGYSRGAAGAIAVAARLKRDGIDVEALLLFDCVDRHLAIDADVIPNNVGYVHHVIRDPKSSSRESFGNDGMRYLAPTVFPAAYAFMCTHGGMGGCPWTPKPGQKMSDLIDEGGIDGMTKITFAQDELISQDVWNQSTGFMRNHGFI